ncbi:MAG: ATP-binding protein [Ferrovibrio sp.]|uniref:ATP-binding protein n=1 Tax=Ferrovibrio sp. TaxID=1917215 RepID=UPI00391A0DF9
MTERKTHTTAPIPRRGRGIPRGFGAVVIVVAALLVAASVLIYALVLNLRDADRDRINLQAAGLSRSLADTAQHQIDVADLLLQFGGAELGDRVSQGLELSTAIAEALGERVAMLPQVDGVHVYDTEGTRRFSTGTAAMPLDVAWHPAFDRHRGGTLQQISAGWTDSASSLWLSRRLTDRNGRFAGVIVASLNITGNDLLDPNYLGLPVSTAALVHEQGRLIVGWPQDQAAELAGLTGFIDGERGHVTIDDTILYWSRLSGFPINVMLRVEQHDIDSNWRRAAIGYGLLLGIVALGAVAALWATWRQLRRRAASEALLQGMMDNPPIVMALQDAQGRYLMVNRHYADLLKIPSERMIGRTAHDFFQPDIAARFDRQIADTVAAGKALVFDSQSNLRDGSERDFILVRFPIYDERRKLLAVGSIATDITERKQLEAALREQAAERERLVESYARQREVAETANRAKSEFLAHMSHELRTPLNAVIGFADMIANQMLGPQSPKYFEYAEDISRSAHHLLGVINDILDVSKIESGKLVLEPGAHLPQDLVDDSLRLVRGRAREAGLKLVSRLDADLPQICVDARAIKQVLINLLGNAMKFTPNGGTITVSGRRSDDGGVILVVADTGIGIAPENLPRVFEPFWQADAGIRRIEGSGLGLSICRKLMELHGGEISVRSAPQQGTEVTLRFPPQCVTPAPKPE